MIWIDVTLHQRYWIIESMHQSRTIDLHTPNYAVTCSLVDSKHLIDPNVCLLYDHVTAYYFLLFGNEISHNSQYTQIQTNTSRDELKTFQIMCVCGVKLVTFQFTRHCTHIL